MCCGCCGKARRLLWRLFIWTLPFTVLPALLGISEAIFFWRLLDTMQIKASNELAEFVTPLGSTASSPPSTRSNGARPEDDTAPPPYYVPDLTNPTAWWDKLGLDRYDINHIDYPTAGFASPMDLSNVPRLFRCIDPDEEVDPNIKEWHHWIYISPSSHRAPSNTPSPWDDAFDSLLQHRYAHPAAHNASFSYLPCADSFLCTLWTIPPPALVHLTTAIPPERPRTPAEARLVKQVRFKPIDMRVLRLGHKSSLISRLPTPKDKLLGPLQMMLAITGTENTFRLLDGYSEGTMLGIYLDENLSRRRKESLSYLLLHFGAFWPASLVGMLGIAQFVRGIVFPLALGVTSLVGPVATGQTEDPWARFLDAEAAVRWDEREREREAKDQEMQERRKRANERREPAREARRVTRRASSRDAAATQV